MNLGVGGRSRHLSVESGSPLHVHVFSRELRDQSLDVRVVREVYPKPRRLRRVTVRVPWHVVPDRGEPPLHRTVKNDSLSIRFCLDQKVLGDGTVGCDGSTRGWGRRVEEVESESLVVLLLTVKDEYLVLGLQSSTRSVTPDPTVIAPRHTPLGEVRRP